MSLLVRLVKSTLGKKYLVAITGLGMYLFVIGHLLGNLQIFLGREMLNKYGNFLQTTPELLWPARIGLLACIIIHIVASISLAVENQQARGMPYAVNKVVDAPLASRTMLWTGLIAFAFICFHIAHFTLMITHPQFRDMHDALGYHDVYGMMVAGFSDGKVSAFYLLGVGLLCFHLSHGAGAMFQSLGLKNEAYRRLIDNAARVLATVFFIGYASIPVSIWAGVVK